MTTINILAPSSSQQGLLIIISSSRIGVNCHEARSSHHSVPEAKSCPPLSQPHGNPLIGWISCHSHFIQVISPVSVIFLGSRSQHDHIIGINHLVIGFVGSYVIIACYIVVAPNKRQPFCGSGLCVLAMDCGESTYNDLLILNKNCRIGEGFQEGRKVHILAPASTGEKVDGVQWPILVFATNNEEARGTLLSPRHCQEKQQQNNTGHCLATDLQ